LNTFGDMKDLKKTRKFNGKEFRLSGVERTQAAAKTAAKLFKDKLGRNVRIVKGPKNLSFKSQRTGGLTMIAQPYLVYTRG